MTGWSLSGLGPRLSAQSQTPGARRPSGISSSLSGNRRSPPRRRPISDPERLDFTDPCNLLSWTQRRVAQRGEEDQEPHATAAVYVYV
eukprot:11939003-Heterocapsa_arctica.AAC.1